VNPEENRFCRRCGHILADDVVEPTPGSESGTEPSGPQLVEGVEVQSYPLVDPKSGEEIPAEVGPENRPGASAPPERRGGTVVWSLGLHLAGIVISAMLAAAVVVTVEREWIEQFSQADTQQVLSEQWQFFQRTDFRDMSEEQRNAELARIMRAEDPETLIRARLILHGGVLLGFLVAGIIAGRLRRPRRLMDVGLGGLLAGAGISLCCCNPIVAMLGFAVSLAGAWLGRRWGLPGE